MAPQRMPAHCLPSAESWYRPWHRTYILFLPALPKGIRCFMEILEKLIVPRGWEEGCLLMNMTRGHHSPSQEQRGWQEPRKEPSRWRARGELDNGPRDDVRRRRVTDCISGAIWASRKFKEAGVNQSG